ncbi:hypothetical protein E1263_31645 [Kribbella antibiotica]|uniref:Uncharacterized protein n=1 Tax=Kribbella antibiotica TaxID=190195 RepID=A0A4R4YWM7_9ACTN|nr:hypothetical protein [Kribbella antibiotica]TDD49868.1 hypothetical protein E1263_31645 [Kribbella antibiotica]
MDLKAYYAENRRRLEIAQREFADRSHGWDFTLAPHASAWAASQPALVNANALPGLVERAGAAGVIRVPEPGVLRSAFASRHPETEVETGVGFGFWPDTAEYLVVHASATIPYAELPALDVLGVLERVVETFLGPRPSYRQS